MTESSLDADALFTELATGLILVTANSRLARVLTVQYGQWQAEKGAGQWPSPEILSWEAWITRLWETAALAGLPGTDWAIPGKQQLKSLWEQAVQDDGEALSLLHPESILVLLSETRRLCADWTLDMRHPAWSGENNENHTAFRRWNGAFEKRCRDGGWLPPEDRAAVLSKAFRADPPSAALPLHGRAMALMGFDEFNPSQNELLAALESAGVELKTLPILPADGQAVIWRGQDSRDETEKMARWVRYWFEKEPESTIAVVVADLPGRRREIETQLARLLTPSEPLEEAPARPWNISYGEPLARLPMIEAAFDLLRWLDSRIDIQDIGRVLRSPWFNGGVSERDSRALLEKCLREHYPRQLKRGEVWYRAGELRKHDDQHRELPQSEWVPQPWCSPLAVELTNQLAGFERQTRRVRPFSDWAEIINELLVHAGWPAAGAQDADHRWQVTQAWQEALRELATLDSTSRAVSRNSAIARLRQICSEQVFQPRTSPARIQVLGLYEASGLRFDRLWVMGLHKDNWPQAARPNPFIPAVLQQDAGLPKCSPQRELEVARTITQRLLSTAPECVFSYPGQVEGEEVLPSPLLTAFPVEPVETVPGWDFDDWQSRIFSAGPPVSEPLRPPGPPAAGTVRGGSSILKHQALCPFRAFATNRLRAEGLETPVEGISPALHGSLVHRVLEGFWRETGSQRNLLALADHELRERVRAHVRTVVAEERSLVDRPEFRKVEDKRLQRLVFAQLELEKRRQPFEVVGWEREILHEIQGQQIRLFIDRIDRLPSGAEVIIDYKTGRVQPGKWFGDRPGDPQLPLYATSADRNPAAVVFSIIRDDGCEYRGITSEVGQFPGLPPARGPDSAQIRAAGENMPVTVENWRQVLHRLMADFLSGSAEIDPKDGARTCANTYCELHSLCRIGELEVSA